ncbi:MAG: hypothetical protein LUD79_05245 [Oscillospiraceae bacterium]|nr:hypothetical protein [Oscillospiraceae bacterium]
MLGQPVFACPVICKKSHDKKLQAANNKVEKSFFRFSFLVEKSAESSRESREKPRFPAHFRLACVGKLGEAPPIDNGSRRYFHPDCGILTFARFPSNCANKWEALITAARAAGERFCVRKRRKNAGILCVFQVFATHFWRKRFVRCRRRSC